MKFISKSSNLLVVLRPGISAQPITGTPAVPAISVRFKDGLVDVEEKDLIDLMIAHPGFNSDFISSEDVGDKDPYENTRKSAEPAHEMTEIKHGTPVGREIKGGDKKQLPPEMKNLVVSMAKELAKEMLPSMVEDTLKELVKDNKKKPGKKPGRPKKKKGRKKMVEPEKMVVEEVDSKEEDSVYSS